MTKPKEGPAKEEAQAQAKQEGKELDLLVSTLGDDDIRYKHVGSYANK